MNSRRSRPPSYSGGVRDSFARETLRSRVPAILTKTISQWYERFVGRPEDIVLAGREVIRRISTLQYELQHDQILRPLEGEASDVALWNSVLLQSPSQTYFGMSWLMAECYVYRRIQEAIETQPHPEIRCIDPFRRQKVELFENSILTLVSLSNIVMQPSAIVGEEIADGGELFSNLMQFQLWGNQADLSISGGNQSSDMQRLQKYTLDHLKAHSSKILANDIPDVWQHVSSLRPPHAQTTSSDRGDAPCDLHMVLDNAGLELFSDLCMADWAVGSGPFSSVVFHVKKFGWFVSDATEDDLRWMIEACRERGGAAAADGGDFGALCAMGSRWQQHLGTGRWRVETDDFWTTPFAYWEMGSVAPALYAKLQSAALVVFKGDLNYRKLTYDCAWDPTTPLETALGPFLPAPLVAIRTAKSDVVVGLSAGVAEALQDARWRFGGDYGFVQFVQPGPDGVARHRKRLKLEASPSTTSQQQQLA